MRSTYGPMHTVTPARAYPQESASTHADDEGGPSRTSAAGINDKLGIRFQDEPGQRPQPVVEFGLDLRRSGADRRLKDQIRSRRPRVVSRPGECDADLVVGPVGEQTIYIKSDIRLIDDPGRPRVGAEIVEECVKAAAAHDLTRDRIGVVKLTPLSRTYPSPPWRSCSGGRCRHV